MGLVELLKASIGTLVAIVHTRLELAATELEEERQRLEQMLAFLIGCIFCVCIGTLLLTLFFIVAYWDTPQRMAVLGAVTAAYFLGAVVLGLRVRHQIRAKPRLFSATLAELYKDRSSLSGTNRN